jgi:hypothetical protein
MSDVDRALTQPRGFSGWAKRYETLLAHLVTRGSRRGVVRGFESRRARPQKVQKGDLCCLRRLQSGLSGVTVCCQVRETGREHGRAEVNGVGAVRNFFCCAVRPGAELRTAAPTRRMSTASPR